MKANTYCAVLQYSTRRGESRWLRDNDDLCTIPTVSIEDTRPTRFPNERKLSHAVCIGMFTIETELKTAADYAALPEDGNRYELIEGELVIAPTPPILHQEVLANLVGRSSTVRKRKLGKMLPLVGLFATDHDVYQPDLLFVRQENLGIIKMNGVHGAPDFVIEILSPSNAYYDLRHKKDVYERIGVREYWIVDPMARTIDCYLNSPNGFESAFLGKQTGRVCSVVVPEFCVEVEEVFAL